MPPWQVHIRVQGKLTAALVRCDRRRWGLVRRRRSHLVAGVRGRGLRLVRTPGQPQRTAHRLNSISNAKIFFISTPFQKWLCVYAASNDRRLGRTFLHGL